MPTPHKGEKESDFVNRCIPIVLHDGSAQDREQAAAMCYGMFRNESMHPDFQRIFTLFMKRYDFEGISKFSQFISKNGLSLSKPYNPEVQFKESFEWVEPLIQPYREDKQAKYYLVTALTADISMNNNDYGDENRLAREDSSMNWRPVNLNHDHNRWLPYPRTRVDFSAANEFSLEATLRVDNRDKWLQDMIDNGDILHPSIEGRPHPINGRYHFTALALLEKGVQLPGSPLTNIVPLAFNECVGNSLCQFRVNQPLTRETVEMLKVENVSLKKQLGKIRHAAKKIVHRIKYLESQVNGKPKPLVVETSDGWTMKSSSANRMVLTEMATGKTVNLKFSYLDTRSQEQREKDEQQQKCEAELKLHMAGIDPKKLKPNEVIVWGDSQ